MKRNYIELSTKCNNISNMRQQLIQNKNLYGGKILKKTGIEQGIASTLRSTGFSGFSPVASFSQSNKFN